MNRRSFLTALTATAATGVLPVTSRAALTTPFTFELEPPMDERAAFVDWMANNRGEDRGYLGQRWDRYQALIQRNDLTNEQTKRAFLLTILN